MTVKEAIFLASTSLPSSSLNWALITSAAPINNLLRTTSLFVVQFGNDSMTVCEARLDIVAQCRMYPTILGSWWSPSMYPGPRLPTR